MSKVFGIGLSRTGTHSLAKALETLGYSCVHYPTSFDQIQQRDAACDIPVTSAFEFLDAMFPGSKFIFTDRDYRDWFGSAMRYFKSHAPANAYAVKIRLAVYGTSHPADPRLLNIAYENIRKRVARYFMGRECMLMFDVKQGWGPLCDFLGKPVPSEPFPWLAKSNE